MKKHMIPVIISGAIFLCTISIYTYKKNISNYSYSYASNLIPAKNEENLWGYVNKDGEEVISYQYEEADPFFSNGVAKVKQVDYGYGLINEDGVGLLENNYDEIGTYTENGLVLVKQGKRNNFVDSFGKKQYEVVGEFSDHGIAPAKQNGKYFFVDKQGNAINDNIYDSVLALEDGKLYKVRCGTKYGAVNGEGREVIPTAYDGMYPTSKDSGGIMPRLDIKYWEPIYAYIIWNGNLYGAADSDGNILCDTRYKTITGINIENQIITAEREEGVWEVIDLNDEAIKEFQAESIYTAGDYILVNSGTKKQFYDENGNCCFETDLIFRLLSEKLLSENRLIFIENNKYGVIDFEKNIIAEPIYDSLSYMEDGEYFIVEQNGKFGYYTKNMEEKIPCQFDWADPFYGEYASVRMDEKWGLINKDGQVVLPLVYDKISGASNDWEGYIAAAKDERWFLIDKTGNQYMDLQFDSIIINSYSGKGLISIWDYDAGVGMINEDLEMVLPIKYATIQYSEKHDCICAKDWNDVTHYFDTDGNELMPIYYGASDISEDGLISVNNGEGFTLYNTEGTAIRYFVYKNVGCFHNGLARVENWDGLIGFMNEEGENITEFEFNDARDFSKDGLAAVCKNGKWGFVDETGKLIKECIYDEVQDFSEGRAAVCIDKKWGYIDCQGKEVIPLKFAQADHFSYSEVLVSDIYNEEGGYRINYIGEKID